MIPEACSIAGLAWFERSGSDPSSNWPISILFAFAHAIDCVWNVVLLTVKDFGLLLLLNSSRCRVFSFSHFEFLIYFASFICKNPGMPSLVLTNTCVYFNIVFSLPATSAKEKLLPYFPHIMEYLKVCDVIALTLVD